MARKPKVDKRQADFFGAPARAPTPAPAKPKPRPVRQDEPGQKTEATSPRQVGHARPEPDGLDALAARLSPAELNELVTSLPDHALAHLVIAAVRQLRRRLARAGRRGALSPLERAARQLVAELGEPGGDDDF